MNHLLTLSRGTEYDPAPEAASLGVMILHDRTAPDYGRYDPERRVIAVKPSSSADYRSAATFQLAYAALQRPTVCEAVAFAAERLIRPDDLRALASATWDRQLWARALRVNEKFLLAHLATRQGLPFPLAA